MKMKSVMAGGDTAPPAQGPMIAEICGTPPAAVAGNLLVSHAEGRAAVGLELVQLDEAAGIQQEVHALAGGELAGLMLPFDAFLAAAELGFPVAPFQFIEYVLHTHAGSSRGWGRGSKQSRSTPGSQLRRHAAAGITGARFVFFLAPGLVCRHRERRERCRKKPKARSRASSRVRSRSTRSTRTACTRTW